MLPVSAWIILLLASVILFGGLALCLRAALKNGRVLARVEPPRDVNRGPENQ